MPFMYFMYFSVMRCHCRPVSWTAALPSAMYTYFKAQIPFKLIITWQIISCLPENKIRLRQGVSGLLVMQCLLLAVYRLSIQWLEVSRLQCPLASLSSKSLPPLCQTNEPSASVDRVARAGAREIVHTYGYVQAGTRDRARLVLP